MSQVRIHHVEGAVARVDGAETAFGRRDSRYNVFRLNQNIRPSRS